MAPRPPDIPDDEDAFLDDVELFYTRRGVPFERQPKVAGRPISLLKLYKLVMDRGGYDQLSGERMQWRTLVKHFGFGAHHEAAMTFQLKTTYFKNLAAYEISSYWGEEPPPPEILENLTAKGGDLRSRTLENYPIPTSRNSGEFGEGVESGDEEQRTPKPEVMDVDDPGSASRYPTRQLRQDPKRTQLFQPDLAPSRQRFPRMTNSPQPSPIPVQAYNSASADPRNPAFSLDKYEPRQPPPLTLRPVVTPGSNPDLFVQRKSLAKPQARVLEPLNFLRPSIPNNMSGPNIYLRCLYGLRSGIADEQNFALHHLVKVSFERGDKYKFEGFPLLAESLLEKALEITELVHGLRWEISYDTPENTRSPNVLNAAFGTVDLLSRLKSLQIQGSATEPETADFLQRLDKLNECALVLRNMIMLEENQAFISRFHLFRDFILIAINLPTLAPLTEFRHYALEMAEQVTKHWTMRSDDPLYLSLLERVDSDDRGTIICALRAIFKIGMETENTYALTGVKLSTVERMTAFLLLDNDDELVSAALDFLYQFSVSAENVTNVMSSNPQTVFNTIPRLISLLLHNATPVEEKYLISAPVKPPPNSIIPAVSDDLYHDLLQHQEPLRSSRWLRCCFEESPQDDITQIAIWQAYQGRFQHNNAMAAAEFIKNVSNTFGSAQAQVINGPQPRFIIKGIRPRRTLVDTTGRPLLRCQWEVARSDLYEQNTHLMGRHLCNSWHSNREKLWSHMLTDHFQIRRNEQGKFPNNVPGQYICKWTTCRRQNPMQMSHEAGSHVRMHIPDSAEAAAKAAEGPYKEAEHMKHTFYTTPVDDRAMPWGIPYMSCLVLKNLARFANRHGGDFEIAAHDGKQKVALMDRFFAHLKPGLWHVLSVSRTLAFHLSDLMKMIEKGEVFGDEGGLKKTTEATANGDVTMLA